MLDTSEIPLGSDAWFAQARRLTADLPERPGCSWRFQFDAADQHGAHRRWYQVVEHGRVMAWQAGELDDPDLELRWQEADLRALHQGVLSGTDALGAVRVLVPGGTEGVAPPLDIGETEELAGLSAISGATLSVQYELSAGPFGPVSFWMSFADGRSSGLGFGQVTDPDATVHISFAKMAAARSGAITILEALEDGGRVDGAVGPLMLLAGLEEGPELHAAELACGPAAELLARVGPLAASSEFGSAMAALAAVTA